MFMTRYSLLFCGALLLLSASNLYAFSCDAHIRNDSDQDWTFQQLSGHGNFWINQDLPNCNRENGPCTIPAGLHVETTFTDTSAEMDGVIRITDHTGKSYDFSYSHGGPPFCASFMSSNGMGVIRFDYPYSLDIQIDKGQWPSNLSMKSVKSE